jgi:O-antigen/teichoic acid export membrane protein
MTSRTKNYYSQVMNTIGYKAVAILATYIAMPMMIHYLGSEKYGIWSTLLTVVTWVVFFDLGIGNGLRNKVAESLANKNRVTAREFIATGYSLIGIISIFSWLTLMVSSAFIPWQGVFNTTVIEETTLRLCMQITGSFIIFNFWIGLVQALLGATQNTSMSALGQSLINIFVILLLYMSREIYEASLLLMAVIYGSSIVISNGLLNLWFFRKNRDLVPYYLIKKGRINAILALGSNFFIIQLAGLVIFTTDKMLITQLIGPASVTQFDIVFKLMSVAILVHTIVSSPLWSAYTEAMTVGDKSWIRDMLVKQLQFFMLIAIGIAVLVATARPLISLWIGDDISISTAVIVSLGTYAVVVTWNNVFAMIVNGIGKIKVQLYAALIGMLINIPLSIVFVKYFDLGISGIVYGSVLSLLIGSISIPLQVYFNRKEWLGI